MAVKEREAKKCSCGRVNKGDKVVASYETGVDEKGREKRLAVACPYVLCIWCGKRLGGSA